MDNLELLSDYSSFLREKKEEGKKIIGFISHDNIPEELFDAAGFIPLRLLFAGNDEFMDASHDYLPPSTCAFAQSCIGLFSLKPNQYEFLDLIDYFIVSNHCVSDICASEIISKRFDIPRLNFYIPYTNNENSIKYFKLELLELKKQLEEINGKEIKDENLKESIKKYNSFKRKLLDFSFLNISGSEKLKILQKAILYGPFFLPELESFFEQRSDNEIQTSFNSKEVLLTGGSIFINDPLIDLVEEGGGNITFFDSWIGNNYYSQIIANDILDSIKNPYDILVHRFKNNNFGDHSVPNFLENKILQLEKIYQDHLKKTGRKLGIINHIIKFCDHISLLSSHLKNRLQEKGIQVLNLERDYSRAIRGQLSTRIEAFLEMI
ncbi:MAG: 2-hydroxyacyl-CoA dehydratase [Promethearchaeota archaeon]|nr:MAG: 2-hydroxyacyl-CoA dehydratase [Candidatus Lokiarchaeota archaeon]